jgi:hypothetical protein
MTGTVHAVVTVTIEVRVRPSSPGETLGDLERVAVKEAEGILRNKLPDDFRIVDKPVFSHAIVRRTK